MSDDRKPGEEKFPAPAQLDPAARAAQKRRNVWLGLTLLVFVVLVGLVTFVRLKESDPGKAGFYYNMDRDAGSEAEAPMLPPGMAPEEAAPPPNLDAEPSAPDEEEPEQ